MNWSDVHVVVEGHGEDRPPLNSKSQCHFQFNTTKSCSILEVIHYFTIKKNTFIVNSIESLVCNRFYIVYDYNHYYRITNIQYIL